MFVASVSLTPQKKQKHLSVFDICLALVIRAFIEQKQQTPLCSTLHISLLVSVRNYYSIFFNTNFLQILNHHKFFLVVEQSCALEQIFKFSPKNFLPTTVTKKSTPHT